MRILCVFPFAPWPIKVRSYNLIPRLAQRHQLDLVCVVRNPTERCHLEAVRPYCDRLRIGTYSLPGALLRSMLSLPTPTPLRIAYVASPSMRGAVEAAIRANPPDVIYVERWRALQYVPPDCNIPVVCDPTDSMTLYNRRLMRTGCCWERLMAVGEFLKFRHYEAKLARRVATTVFCSRVDMDFVQALAPEANLVQVVNGVDCELFRAKSTGEEQPDRLFFSGNFTYRPNCHAATYFLRKVLPIVKQAVPAVKLVIVGNQAKHFVDRNHAGIDGVEARDFVPEMRPYLAAATVAVAPITVGAGVSNKLLEAFAVGTPIVATSIACGDLPVRDGEHLFIAEAPALFAERVVTLLENANLRQHMAQRALTLVRREFDWDLVSRQMERVLCEAAQVEQLEESAA
jgi:glycosyltransferase involved in cell wall biosynthesis